MLEYDDPEELERQCLFKASRAFDNQGLPNINVLALLQETISRIKASASVDASLYAVNPSTLHDQATMSLQK